MLAPPDSLRGMSRKRGRATRVEMAARLDAILDRIKPCAKESERRPPRMLCKVVDRDAGQAHLPGPEACSPKADRCAAESEDRPRSVVPNKAEAAMTSRGLPDDEESPTAPNWKDSIREPT
jgi:hypothetical protein